MPPPDELRAHLQKLLSSQALSGSDQLKRLLQVVVERTASGQSNTVKEYTLGVEAFGRPPDYDPKIDPIVRVQARRLRTKLDEFYAAEGAAEPIRITLPKGGYVPSFEMRSPSEPQPSPRGRQWAVVVGAILIVSGIVLAFTSRQTAARDLRSIAVLPLRNIATASSGPSVAEEATETLITSLARTNKLRVASATSTRNAAGANVSLPVIAQSLQVRWIVEGAVGREDERILLKLRLVDATSDRKAWADVYTFPLSDLSAAEQRAADSLVAAIERALGQPPDSKL